MLLEPPKSCTQATCIVTVVLCVQNKLPLKGRDNKIRDFNWQSHFTQLVSALVRGKTEKQKQDCKEKIKNFNKLFIQQE